MNNNFRNTVHVYFAAPVNRDRRRKRLYTSATWIECCPNSLRFYKSLRAQPCSGRSSSLSAPVAKGGCPDRRDPERPSQRGGVGHKPRTTKSGNGGDGNGAGNSENGLTEDIRVADCSRGHPEAVDVAEGPEGALLKAPEQRLFLIYDVRKIVRRDHQ